MEGEPIKTELANDSQKIETPKPMRDEKGRLLPGVILNPEGKRAGTKHFKTLFIEAVKEIGAKNARGEDISKDKVIVKKVVEKAMSGDLKAADMVFERVDGDKEEPVPNNIIFVLGEEEKRKLLELL